MVTINPYIIFNGNSEEAFTFYKSVFGGEFAKIIRFKDLSGPAFQVADKDANKIMHIALRIGKIILIGNDVPESMGQANENENRSKISISAGSRKEADKLFNGLSGSGAYKANQDALLFLVAGAPYAPDNFASLTRLYARAALCT